MARITRMETRMEPRMARMETRMEPRMPRMTRMGTEGATDDTDYTDGATNARMEPRMHGGGVIRRCWRKCCLDWGRRCRSLF